MNYMATHVGITKYGIKKRVILILFRQSHFLSHTGIFAQMGYAAGGAVLGGVVGGPAGAMVGGIVGKMHLKLLLLILLL